MFTGPGRLGWSVLFCLLSASYAFPCTIPENMADLQASLIKSVNAERRAAGLSTLRPSAKLDRAAQSLACDNAQRQMINHVGSDGSTLKTRIKRAGYSYKVAAENVGRGFSGPARAVDWWMHSEKHRLNILLQNTKELGVGIAVSDAPDSKLHWVLVVGAGR